MDIYKFYRFVEVGIIDNKCYCIDGKFNSLIVNPLKTVAMVTPFLYPVDYMMVLLLIIFLLG